MILVSILKKFEVHSVLILSFLIVVRQLATEKVDMPAITACDFEVYGRVQGVFFRKYTEAKAKELGLNGWCMNTKQGTVKGYLEGNKTAVEEMKNWLKTTGSPQSAIDKAEFTNEKELDCPTNIDGFSIKK